MSAVLLLPIFNSKGDTQERYQQEFCYYQYSTLKEIPRTEVSRSSVNTNMKLEKRCPGQMSAGVPLFSFETIPNLHVIKHYLPSKTAADELCLLVRMHYYLACGLLTQKDGGGWGGTLDAYPSSHTLLCTSLP